MELDGETSPGLWSCDESYNIYTYKRILGVRHDDYRLNTGLHFTAILSINYGHDYKRLIMRRSVSRMLKHAGGPRGTFHSILRTTSAQKSLNKYKYIFIYSRNSQTIKGWGLGNLGLQINR